MHPSVRLLCFLFLLLVVPIETDETVMAADLRVDIPVNIQAAKVVFNMDRAVFRGDEPVGLNFMRVMREQFHADGANPQIIAVFHGEAGYMLLNDAAYDRVRYWQHGNPYKDQIAMLQQAGVEFEECGETMLVDGWQNSDLLPGVKVNTSANLRIIQLVQQGYVQIQP